MVTIVINPPYKMKQFFKFASDKPTKTDKKDAKIITHFIEYFKENNSTISGNENL